MVGATTFRLCTNGLTIFLDTWLERPDVLPKYLDINNVTEADYIFISHAHFDQQVSVAVPYMCFAKADFVDTAYQEQIV